MAQVVLFHSALGLRPAVLRAADRLRDAGHVVHTPDLYDGAVFDDTPTGVAHYESIGWSTVMQRAASAVEPLAGGLVHAGFSMGAGVAQRLAAVRAGARGAVLLHGGGSGASARRWPAVPVALHHAVDDPWVDAGAPAALVETAARAGVTAELHVYPAPGHLFTDEDSPEHDAASAALLWRRVLSFLAEVDGAARATTSR